MKYVFRLALLLGAVVLCGCETVAELPLSPFSKRIPFSVEVNGAAGLEQQLRQELTLYRKTLQTEQFSQPRKIAYLERQLLESKLQSEGYYRSRIQSLIEPERLTYRIEPGMRYSVARVHLSLPENLTLPVASLPIAANMPLLAETVLEGRAQVEKQLAERYCLQRVKVDYRVTLDHEKSSANVLYKVADSPQLLFGDVKINGLTSIEESFLLDRLPFRPGDCFKRKQLDRARLNLLQTNLVASVSITEHPTQQGRLAIELGVTERGHRTITAGAGFDSDEGFGVSAGWEHRNLMGRGQKLSIDGHLAEKAHRLSSNLTFPHIWRNNQALTVYAEFSSENPDAYESRSGTFGIELTRQLKQHLRFMVGGELAFSRVTEDEETEDYALLSVPMNLELDYRDDPLDPTSGWVAAVNVRPYWDAYDTGTRFIRSTLAASGYLTSTRIPTRPTLALRSATGTITGIERDEVPANIRFYSGGGGSVRGYGFQSLGPLDEDDEPEGGLSFAEISLELRLRWSENWGSVLFVDGGSAYAGATPQFDQSLRWGAGLGLRYYTSFAPIRFDIGVPLDKREDLDSNFEVYVSIGQAF